MRRTQTILIAILMIVLFSSCEQEEKTKPEPVLTRTTESGKELKVYHCQNDSFRVYMVYEPSNITGDIPVLFVFPPLVNDSIYKMSSIIDFLDRNNGNFLDLAKQFNFLIVGIEVFNGYLWHPENRGGRYPVWMDKFVKDVISEIEQIYKINKDKIYASGWREGADIALYYPLRFPAIFKAGCAVGGDLRYWAMDFVYNANKKDFFLYHYSHSIIERVRDILEEKGAFVETKEYEGQYEYPFDADEEFFDFLNGL